MTVAALSSVVSYIEDGVTTAFAAPFRFRSASDLIVERIVDGDVQLLVLNVDYTVSGGSTDAGGTVTRLLATNGATLEIRRHTDRAQPMVYTTGDRFPAISHEQALDRQMLIAQEQDADIADINSRAILLPPGESPGAIPSAVVRAGAFLGFDGLGAFLLYTASSLATAIAPYLPTALKGDPGANVMAIGVFAVISNLFIPDGTDLVQTSGYATAGHGQATYARDDSVTLATVAQWPYTAAVDRSGRGWRLSEATVSAEHLGAIFDGRDNTDRIKAATAHVAAYASNKDVVFPHGDCFLSGTVEWAAGVTPVGQGSLNTRFRRTGDYGDTFLMGTLNDLGGGVSVRAYNNSGGGRGFCIYQDNGAGLFPPNDVNVFTNKTTNGAHLNIPDGANCQWEDILLIGNSYCVKMFGGRSMSFKQIDCIGTWNPHDARMQQTAACIDISGNTQHIPTEIEFYACRISGSVSPQNQTIYWPGGFTTSDTVENWGPFRGLDVRCSEGVRWFGGYLGAASYCNVRLQAATGNILSAFGLWGAFVDSCGAGFTYPTNASTPGYVPEGINNPGFCGPGLFIDRAGGAPSIDITWSPSEHNGQGNAFVAISDKDYPVNTGSTLASFIGLTVTGLFRVFIGNIVYSGWGYLLYFQGQARSWNTRGFYDGSAAYDAGFYLGGGCRGVKIDGIVGGGPNGDGGLSHDKTAVRYDMTNPNPNNVVIAALIRPATTPSGSSI